MHHTFQISVIDDDISMRESLEGLLKSLGFHVRTFTGAEDFLESDRVETTDCLILDVCLEGMSGPELQRQLKQMRSSIPIVFVTAHGSEILCSRLVAEGAIACLLKPFSEESLLAAVTQALTLRTQST